MTQEQSIASTVAVGQMASLHVVEQLSLRVLIPESGQNIKPVRLLRNIQYKLMMKKNIQSVLYCRRHEIVLCEPCTSLRLCG